MAPKGEIKESSLLRERHFGVLEGRPIKDWTSQPKFDGWPGTFTPEGGESWGQVRERVKEFFFEVNCLWDRVILSSMEISVRCFSQRWALRR